MKYISTAVYILSSMERTDEYVEKQVLRRLELCYRLGKGTYGMVWKVIEKRTRRVIVLKKYYL